MPREVSWFPSSAAFVTFFAFLGLLVVMVVVGYCLVVMVAKAQDGRPKDQQCRDNKGKARAEQPWGKGHLLGLLPLPEDFAFLDPSEPLKTHDPTHLEMDGVHEIVHEFNRTIEDLIRHLKMSNCKTPEGSNISLTHIMTSEIRSSSNVLQSPSEELPTSTMTSEGSSSAEVSLPPLNDDDSWTTITDSDTSCSSRVSLSSLREECHTSILTSEDSFSTEPSLAPLNDDCWTAAIRGTDITCSSSVILSSSREDCHISIMSNEGSSSAEVPLYLPNDSGSWTTIITSDTSCSSQATLLKGADMADDTSIQLGLGHPRTNLVEQPGPDTLPPREEELLSCLEPDTMQQHQQEPEIHQGAPTSPLEVFSVHSSDTETPFPYHKGQETSEGTIPEIKLLRELGLLDDVDEAQNVPASAPPTSQPPKKGDVVLVPIVQDLPFLDETVRMELEAHIVKIKIQKRHGLHMSMLQCEQCL
ncbi:uncharacterized protein [Heliangelus exortis]|uniref:uncharacterized protein n=1 Tax=Heliangelus exortis TaxID=472823 RepID=UPI003A922812